MRRTVRVLAGSVLFAALAAAAGYRGSLAVQRPYKGFSGAEAYVEIAPGTSSRAIAETLAARGVIESPVLFLVALRWRGATGYLQAGEYRFDGASTVVNVIDRLVRGDVHYASVTIPEGLTLWETAALLGAGGLGERAALEAAFSHPDLIAALDPMARTLEGYLYPETYRFPRNPAPEDVARILVGRFLDVFEDEGRHGRADALGLSPREVVTLASVVEKETASEPERPVIASVFFNRLARRIPLQSDPTIIYDLKRRGVYDGDLRRSHLKTLTAYNTYMRPGLPPGPIASPGAAAIDAVIDPAKTSYLYFVSKNDGSHQFSASLREHNAAVRKYQVEYFKKLRRERDANRGAS